MKKSVIVAFVLFLVVIGAGVFAAKQQLTNLVDQVTNNRSNEVIVLYDEAMSLSGCALSGTASCADLDGTSSSEVQIEISVERYVAGSGYLGVYFVDNSNISGNYEGGFTSAQAYFVPNSGSKVSIGEGMQIFERGNVVLEFDQPYRANERIRTEYEIVLYYLPHSEIDRSDLLTRLQDDQQGFDSYKIQNKDDISALCFALSRETRVPKTCPGASVVSDSGSDVSFSDGSNTFSTDPSDLPELDFSGEATRRPEITLQETERQTFVAQPVTLKITEVYDPDGKCKFYQYKWQKSSRMQVKDVSLDPRLGDLSFVPQNTGVFTVKVQVQEACEELGTLLSEKKSVRVIVNDKSIAFPDLAQAPKYQNAIYHLYHLGVLTGYPDGTMRPNDPVNRAEFLKMIFETLNYRIDDSVYSPRYSDVLPDAWFASYVFQADVLGVIKGYPDGQFRAWQTVNLVEALKMAMNFTTLEIKDGIVYNFKDVNVDDWFSRYVQTAYREGILDDIEPGANVYPGQPISRGKAALIIVRTLLFPVNRINDTNKDVQRRADEFEDFSSFSY